MPLNIGFVLLTYQKPHQAARLVKKLNVMFGSPPIAWHHDFTQCDLNPNSVTSNISLVRPHITTAWGSFSVIEAMLRALEMLFASDNAPDWFVFLSGADYPIKTADQISQDLLSSQYDAHISHIKIHYYDTEWMRMCYDRYCTLKIRTPSIFARGRSKRRVITIAHPLLTRPFLPFSKQLACFAGEFWFCANRRAAKCLIDFHRDRPALAKHYRRMDSHVIVPEESYYQTVLCNSATLRISNNHFRYIDWKNGDGSHPKILTLQDLAKLRDSSAHFARKFDPDVDERILHALDCDTM